MTDDNTIVPVYTLATKATSLPDIGLQGPMTPERLSELRTVLAAMADSPITTLEAHPVPRELDRSSGIALHAASPLAQHLSQLVMKAAKSVPAPKASEAAAGGEVLYRMVVPAKVAKEFGSNAIKPMTSKAVPGGIHGALVGGKHIAAQATFMPVAGPAATAGAAAGSATTAGVAVASAGALTVATPLVLMAVAVGVSAYADHQRQQAIDRITELLEQLHESMLDDERNALDGCRGAISKATALLLDKGRIGISLGLDSAVHEIDKAIANAARRLKKWQTALDEIPGDSVELEKLRDKFKDIGSMGGEFQTQLELAMLAIALKRRVIMIQAVDHAQMDEGNQFESFVSALRDDSKDVDKLESGIASVLRRLSTLELSRRRGIRDMVLTSREVDDLLRSAYQLRELGERLDAGGPQPDVAIDIVRSEDGSVVVLPARPAA